jgi:hypothetical protein
MEWSGVVKARTTERKERQRDGEIDTRDSGRYLLSIFTTKPMPLYRIAL